MPAISADPAILPRVSLPAAGALERSVLGVSTALSGLEGEGFPVRRAFAGIDLRHIDPFIMMDQMGAVEWAAGAAKGTPWHPHRGFETVTYLLDGVFRHQDSHGGGGIISDGDTQWMTAGAGVLHIEAPTEQLVASGGLMHGFQLWVNLPAALKGAEPRYQDITSQHLRLLASDDGGAVLRLIAGDLGGHAGPGVTHTPITLIHATISPGARLSLPWPAERNALVYVLSGSGTVGPERRPIHDGQTAVFGPGAAISVFADAVQESRAPYLDLLLLGGRPIGEPVAWGGPFVMNTEAEVRQAFADYRGGRMGQIPASR